VEKIKVTRHPFDRDLYATSAVLDTAIPVRRDGLGEALAQEQSKHLVPVVGLHVAKRPSVGSACPELAEPVRRVSLHTRGKRLEIILRQISR
jgi:hypothetical protein